MAVVESCTVRGDLSPLPEVVDWDLLFKRSPLVNHDNSRWIRKAVLQTSSQSEVLVNLLVCEETVGNTR